MILLDLIRKRQATAARRYEVLPKELTQEVRRSILRRVATELERPGNVRTHLKRHCSGSGAGVSPVTERPGPGADNAGETPGATGKMPAPLPEQMP